MDDIVIIPLRAARSRVLGAQQEIDPDENQLKLTSDLNNEKKPGRPISYPHQANYQALDYLVIKYGTSASARQVKQAVEDALRARRGIAREMKNDFGIFDPAEALEVQEATAKSFSWLLAAIASISLAVGGISIMNTMLVSVTERTREIGLRQAVGAKTRDILLQFLVEAVTLSLLGGILGIVLGLTASVLISHFAQWTTQVSMLAILLAFVFSALVGVFFGYYPARKAAFMDPIEALRYE
jgi:putative ABC transport system permease protein